MRKGEERGCERYLLEGDGRGVTEERCRGWWEGLFCNCVVIPGRMKGEREERGC